MSMPFRTSHVARCGLRAGARSTRALPALALLAACTGGRPAEDAGAADAAAGDATALSAGPEPLVSVAFENPRNQVVLQVAIGDAGPFNFLLDTATDPSGLDLATADSLGIAVDRASGGLAVGTGSEDVRIYPVAIGGLSIGGVPFDTVPAMASTFLTMIGERLGMPLHGVLGVSFLHDKAVVIDYPARRVHIYDEALPVREGANVVSIPMERNGNDVVVPGLAVNGRPLRVTLDTGSSLVLSVYASAAERLGLDSLRANAREETVRGFRGEASILVATVDSIGLGPLVVRDAEVSFPERDGTTDGNLGNGYLQNFILTVDYLSERVTLERP
jgi:predicted aspartyl protease